MCAAGKVFYSISSIYTIPFSAKPKRGIRPNHYQRGGVEWSEVLTKVQPRKKRFEDVDIARVVGASTLPISLLLNLDDVIGDLIMPLRHVVVGVIPSLLKRNQHYS